MICFHIFSTNLKDITDNEPLSSPNQYTYQRHSTKALQDKSTSPFVCGKEEKVKRYSLYDKWTSKDNIINNSTIQETQHSKNDSYKKEIKEEDKLSWEETKEVSSVNLTKDIKQGSEEEIGERKIGSFTDVKTNLQGKTILFFSYVLDNKL